MTLPPEASNAPEHWSPARLSEIAEVRLGRQRSPDRATGVSPCPYLRAANLTWRGFDLTDIKVMDFSPDERRTFRLEPGDILLNEASGSPSEVGKAAVWSGQIPLVCFQNTLIRVRAPECLVPFLLWRFQHDALLGHFAAASRGVGIHHLGAAALQDWEVSLPPLGEQLRIVASLKAHFTRLDEAEAALERAEATLESLRASILQAAVEGRLVPTEAELARRERRSYEPATVLLDRILAERRKRWEASGRRGKYEAPVLPDTSSLPDLPEGWAIAPLGAIAEVEGGIAKSPDRVERKGLRPVAYLRVANVQRGYLDLNEVKLIYATEAEIAALGLQPGDVLLNEGGDRDKLGRGWIWRGEIGECIHQNHVFRARLCGNELAPQFVSWYANTAGIGYFTREGRQTTNLASISLSTLRALPVALPPAAEQRRIVEEVERRTAEAGSVGEALAGASVRVRALRSSILRLAFSGGLVDPEPSDGPASALLERIRAERAREGAAAGRKSIGRRVRRPRSKTA
ncbi:MAG: restriction endonuclease subunit S [Planctomycetes bacterium]|nr:restriction endonuclease subunit S [Planctomycetota bacterium]